MNLVLPNRAAKNSLDEQRVSSSLNPLWSHEALRPGGAGTDRLRMFEWQSDAPSYQRETAPGGMTLSLAALQRSAVLGERSRLAREIHDTLVQEFAGILLNLQAAMRADDAERSRPADCLARARDLAKRGLEDARRMLLALRPEPLESLLLSEALSQLADRFSQDCNITCKFRMVGRDCEIPFQVQDELYRVTQEALCNARKHSRASSVSLLLACGSHLLVLTIKDSGRGFAASDKGVARRGFGLETMQERIQSIGGRIEIDSVAGTGTEIRIVVPLKHDALNHANPGGP